MTHVRTALVLGLVVIGNAANVAAQELKAGGSATLSEFRQRDTGLALGVGFGVDVPLTPQLSLRPEFRSYSSTAMSRVNLGMHRGTIGLRYRW